MQNTKMTCPLQTDNADVLLDYCARALDQDRKAMLEAHMVSCPACREMAATQAQIWSALDDFDAAPVSVDFDRKLYARIESLDRVSAWDRFWAPVREYLQGQPAWKPVLSIAAASAVLAVVLVVRSDVAPPVEQRSNLPAAMIDVQDVEKAERALEDMEMLRQFDAAVVSDNGGANAQKEVL